MQIINQTSYIIFAVVLLFAAGYLLLRDGLKWYDFLILAGLIALLIGVWLIFKPASTTNSDASLIEARIGSGSPVLLEIQSPY